MGELNIDTMCANTPQAKGRVERANSTLQNRLVKELRLAGISSMGDGNAFAPGFIDKFNERFAREPLNPHDAHRPLRADENLRDLFTWQEQRKVSRALTLHYQRVMYVLDKSAAAKRAMGKQVTIYESEDGQVTIRHDGQELSAHPFEKRGHVRQAAIVDNKLLSAASLHARALQDMRDQERLNSPSLNKRDKRLLRARRAQAATLNACQ
jgi:hypothetical protein